MRRLRLQLIGLLVLAIVLPLLPATFVARELFRRSFDPLLTSGLSEAAGAGVAVTRDVLEEHKARWLGELRAGAVPETLDAAALAQLRLEAPDAAPYGGGEALGALRLVSPPEVRTTDSAVMLVARVRGEAGEPVWIARAAPDTLAARALSLARAARLLQALRLERSSLERGFEATFLVAYLAMVAIVLGLGLLLASRLTRPLADLTEGIDRIAAGDLTTRVPERGSGEVAELMRHFNAMGQRLHAQQADLARLERLAVWRQMARFLAHEIKNPLTPIQLAAEQMRDAYDGDDDAYRRLVHEGAAIVHEEVLGMRNLVAEFSQFARLPEVRAERVAAEELAAELLALYGSSRLAVNLAALAGPPAGGALWCDRESLKRALVNLVDNALAAQQSVGRSEPVELSFAPHGGGAMVRVRDHGPGVPEDRKGRVFEPDYTTRSEGTGLGLAIVENIVLGHGGAVAVQDAPGGGAIFAITLPGPTPAGGSAA